MKFSFFQCHTFCGNAFPLVTLPPRCTRSDMHQNLMKGSHTVTVPICSVPWVGDSGLSILAWSCGEGPHAPCPAAPGRSHAHLGWCWSHSWRWYLSWRRSPCRHFGVWGAVRAPSRLKVEMLEPRCVPCPSDLWAFITSMSSAGWHKNRVLPRREETVKLKSQFLWSNTKGKSNQLKGNLEMSSEYWNFLDF